MGKIEPEHIYKFHCSIFIFIDTPTEHHILFFESPNSKGLLVTEGKLPSSLQLYDFLYLVDPLASYLRLLLPFSS